MIRKLTLAAGFGAGYVLGAKAGTQRYDQIVAKAREIAGMPAVQDAAQGLQQTASTLADRAVDTVSDAASAVGDKVSGGTASSPSTTVKAPPAKSVVDLNGTAAPRLGAAASATAPDAPKRTTR